MILSETHRELIESLGGHPCLCSSLSTYRPCAPEFEAQLFNPSWALAPLEWTGSGRIIQVRVVETETQVILTTCNDDSDATIETYIINR